MNPLRTKEAWISSLITAVSAILVLGPLSIATTPVMDPSGDPVAEALGDLAPLLALQADATALPSDPTQALIDSVRGLQADIGFGTDPTGQILEANLDSALAGRIAQALDALRACNQATQAAITAVGLDAIVDGVRGSAPLPEATAFQGIHDCALPAAQTIANLEDATRAESTQTPPTPVSVSVWPILFIDRGSDNVYENDYMLIVDTGGNDVYDNNAGSNMIDTRFAPESSPVPGRNLVPCEVSKLNGGDCREGFGPSEGCAIALGSLLAGNCTPMAAALIDTEGTDQYGVFKSPVAGIDARCTNDDVIRRMVTNGVGFLGFGMLLDTVGNDLFNGRTGSNGAGHIFGVGVLQDRLGDDHYLDVRNAQGFSLIGDLGLLLDEQGNDDYDFYMPGPRTTSIPQEGGGGVIDDENVCDNVPRFVQGAGDAGGVGILVDRNGVDSYRGACSDDFGAPGDIGAPACSQGFGQTGGVGILVDTGRDGDSYTGVPDRGDNKVLVRFSPSVEANPSQPTNVERSLALDIFIDARMKQPAPTIALG